MLKRVLLIAVLGGVALYVVGSALAKKGGGKPSGNLPAVIEFESHLDGVMGDLKDPEDAVDWTLYANGSGKDKVQVEIVLGGHLSFSTRGSAKADRVDGDGRTLFVDFTDGLYDRYASSTQLTSISLDTMFGTDYWELVEAIEWTGDLVEHGIVTEASMWVGGWRFGDEDDGFANAGEYNKQWYWDDFDLRAMTNSDKRHDVNVRITIIFSFPDRTSTNLRLLYEPTRTGFEGSDFATVECTEVATDGTPIEWKVYPMCQYSSDGGLYPSMAVVREGGGGDEFKGYWYFPFEATIRLP